MSKDGIFFAGLDAGSISVKLVILDTGGNILKSEYVRHKGKPLTAAYDLLAKTGSANFLSITGSAGKFIAQIFGISPVNEIVAQSYSTRKLFPSVRTIIEMGGEDSKLILLKNGVVKGFSMNSVCAAGTGSFLDQQAERLRLGIEDFSRIALNSKSPPRIAGRCSVFAKSDMIHLQQIATPVEDIVTGLCFAVARNFKGSICKNTEISEPASFQGGVAANKGVIRAIKEVFNIKQLIIPEHYALMPAIGAALSDIEQGMRNTYDIEKLRQFIASERYEEKGHEPLANGSEELRVKSYELEKEREELSEKDGSRHLNAYLGIDIGSISTNLAVIDEGGQLFAKRYLMTSGRPIEAVRQGLDEIGREIGDSVQILGVGTTGSGRYMIADFVGADIVKNEITAQATAAIAADPEVDTIFEIGGQDSKYISLKNGVIVDFEMNKACAAGTGSFLEEQAEKLGISIKEEFSALGFKSQRPCSLGERCTVFMESSLLSKQQRGVSKEDLVAGLSYSIVQNYINRVVGDRKIGEKIFFQGGVAFNKAVMAAFEKYLNKKIFIPPHHDVTGAIGMALIAMRHMKSQNTEHRACLPDRQAQNTDNPPLPLTKFKGFDLSKRNYGIKSFDCKGCENLCEINSVHIEGEKDPLFYGSRCEKYDVKHRQKSAQPSSFPDLFAEREELLLKTHNNYRDRSEELKVKSYESNDKNAEPCLPAGRRSTLNHAYRQAGAQRIRIGIPRIFFFHDFLPFWSTFLWELGFEAVLSDKTNRQIINMGVESILSESCFPHKAAHGHIKNLINKNVDAVLIPSFINLNSSRDAVRSFACPYVQTMPYISKTAFGGLDAVSSGKIKFLSPVINTEFGINYFIREIYRTLMPYKIPVRRIKNALKKAEEAQKQFVSAVKLRGQEVLNNISGKTIVILGRSYNAFDSGINLDIPKKLSRLGVFSIPMDYLPVEGIDITKTWPNMYWRSGQNILKAATIIRDNPDLFALSIGNFSCGPDSFIHRYFKETMGSKPFLQIEIDEHSADAGVITRCEAFLDSIEKRPESGVRSSEKKERITRHATRFTVHASRIVYIPRMSDHAFAIAAAFESCGLDAEVLDVPDAETVKTGRRYVSGKECYPCAVTTGDMIKKVRSKDFNPSRAAFFMPSGSGPCRFGQYNIFHRLVLNELGFPHVPIFAPNQDVSFYAELGIIGKDFTKQAWKGVTATELLMKCLHETRPYETNKGESGSIYQEYLTKISRGIKSRNGVMPEILKDMKKAFSGIRKTPGRKPLIGIIGEIFVRHNSFSNENLISKIEALGGEVWLAPVEEWLYYINLMSLHKAARKLKNNFFSKNTAAEFMSIFITRFVQRRIEHKYSAEFKDFLKTLKEPDTGEILKNASPYLHKSFEGEAILSMGKAVDFVKNSASGIISAMPFGCMPGTIVSALLKGFQQNSGIPCLSVAYDGVETTCSAIQLEAFMHQTKEFHKVNSEF